MAKKSKKVSAELELPTALELLTSDVAELYLAHFETKRQLMRVTAACLLSAGGSTDFPTAYRTVLIQEKTQLFDLLKAQLKELSGLRTPEPLLKEKKQEMRTVEKALARLKKQTPAQVAANLALDLAKCAGNDAVNLSTSFVSSPACNFLNGENGLTAKNNLLAGI